jgi:hypothetical protein
MEIIKKLLSSLEEAIFDQVLAVSDSEATFVERNLGKLRK